MLFASAVPLQPGKTDRYRSVGVELEPHIAEYAGLNARYGVARHAYWINYSRLGVDLGVSVYDIDSDGFEAMKRREWDQASAHDAWWLEFVRDVNGVDLLTEGPHAAPPEQVFAWNGGAGSGS